MAVNGNIAAVLLAAGRSRRMGAFKPLLPWGSVSVVEACVESLRGAGVLEVVVVVGKRGAEVRAALAHVPALRFAVNEEAGSEMGVSLARGVEALREETSAVLVALVDHPAVPPSEVRRLIEARRSTGARLVVPEWQGRGGHPVLVDLAFRAELLSLSPEKGLRALFDAQRAEVLRVPADSPYVARDMDTWEDYLALHTEVFGPPPSSFRG
ncbi:MAG: molybdenum cofactor cytidylyltransferase [Acidobacteriota bacterium]|jgi:molybdenum cofactor cytidylyltransferase|nr:molybdenum cofactor cytidylyltransferase [Acidobacteriota bacterium]